MGQTCHREGLHRYSICCLCRRSSDILHRCITRTALEREGITRNDITLLHRKRIVLAVYTGNNNRLWTCCIVETDVILTISICQRNDWISVVWNQIGIPLLTRCHLVLPIERSVIRVESTRLENGRISWFDKHCWTIILTTCPETNLTRLSTEVQSVTISILQLHIDRVGERGREVGWGCKPPLRTLLIAIQHLHGRLCRISSGISCHKRLRRSESLVVHAITLRLVSDETPQLVIGLLRYRAVGTSCHCCHLTNSAVSGCRSQGSVLKLQCVPACSFCKLTTRNSRCYKRMKGTLSIEHWGLRFYLWGITLDLYFCHNRMLCIRTTSNWQRWCLWSPRNSCEAPQNN